MDWSYLVELGYWLSESPHRDVTRLQSSAILLLSYQQNVWNMSIF